MALSEFQLWENVYYEMCDVTHCTTNRARTRSGAPKGDAGEAHSADAWVDSA